MDVHAQAPPNNSIPAAVPQRQRPPTEQTPLILHRSKTQPVVNHQQEQPTDESSVESPPVVSPPEPVTRRASFLGFGLTGSTQITLSRENDKLLNYCIKSPRVNIVRELRPQKLIGDLTRLFDWSTAHKSEEELSHIKNRAVKNFYRDQNTLIEKYIEVDKLLDSGIQHTMIKNYSDRNGDTDESDAVAPYEAEEERAKQIRRRESAVPGDIDLETGNLLGYNKDDEIAIVNKAITVNFMANVVLLIGKAIVALLTSSISIVASVLDSALDFLSTLIIYFSNKLSQSEHTKEFPVGKNRLEPLGVLVFSIIIIISFTQIGLEAIERLYGEAGEIVEIGTLSIIIMVSTIVTKLMCFFWCKTIKSSSVEALTQDALVDVIFNSFSIFMPVVGYYLQIWWCDPLGALMLSCYIVYLWSATCVEHITNLTGKKADPHDYQVILYLCLRFAEKIDKIKDINCYHVGDSINVEVDLVLDPSLGVKDSHDIAEALQYTIEALPIVNVERAFVHIDYTVGNFRGHLS